MHLIDVENKPQNQHRFFVDDVDQAKCFDPVKQFDTHESLLNRRSNRLTLDQLKRMEVPEWCDDAFMKEIAKKRKKKYKELVDRCKRSESLRKLEHTYDLKPVFIYFLLSIITYLYMFSRSKYMYNIASC